MAQLIQAAAALAFPTTTGTGEPLAMTPWRLVAGNRYSLTISVPALSALANGQVIANTPNLPTGAQGTLRSAQFRVGATPASTAAKLATATLGISGVACTGGVISLTSANCTPAGNSVASTTITALNTFTGGQSIGFTISAVTAFVEGNGDFLVYYTLD